MKKRNIIILSVVAVCAIIAVLIYGFTSNKKEVKESDAVIFKNIYEELNNETREKDGKVIRSILIDEDNPMILSNAEEIIKMINNKDSFVVYFGFSDCPWCRSVLETMIKSAKENNIDKIYYVDVKTGVRDVYTLDENNKAIRTTEGSESYYQLLELLDSVLSDYSPLSYINSKGKQVNVKIDEKRIYAPNIITVKNGKALGMTEGISELQKDGYAELTDDILTDEKKLFDELFETYNGKSSTTCSLAGC